MLRLLAALGGPIVRMFVPIPSYQQAKTAGIAVLVVLLVVGLGVAKCVYDRNLIADHDAGRTAVIANRVVEADRTAGAASDNRVAEFEATQDKIENAAAVARAADPGNAAKPVGPVTRSYYDTLPEKKK